jgi:hypothetical protein
MYPSCLCEWGSVTIYKYILRHKITIKLHCLWLPVLIIVTENRKSNQEWATERYMQHRAQDTENEDKQKKKKNLRGY